VAQPHAEYMADYRQRNPQTYARQLAASRAFRRALTALKDEHPEDFNRLLTLERAAVGLPPVGAVPRGRKPREVAA